MYAKLNSIHYPIQQPPLLVDNNLYAHPECLGIPSITLNMRVDCTINVVILAHWVVHSQVPVSIPFHAMNMLQMTQYLDNVGLHDFPVYNGVFGPNGIVLVLHHGRPRFDHTAITYIPAHAGRMAHWAFVKYVHPQADNCQNYVYFGSVYLGPSFYWHATQPSPEYFELARVNRACLCKNRCIHEAQHALYPSFSFVNEVPNITRIRPHYVAEVVHMRGIDYTHGPDNSLNRLSRNGLLSTTKNAFSVAEQYVLDQQPQIVSTAALDLNLYLLKQDTNIWKVLLAAVAFSGLLSSILFIPPLEPKTETIGDYLKSFVVASPPPRLIDRVISCLKSWHFKPRPIEHIPTVFRRGIWGFLSRLSWLTYGSFIGFTFVNRLRGYCTPKLVNPLRYYRSAIPCTMRIAETDFGHKLASRVAVYDQWTKSDLYVLVRRLANEMRYAHNLDPYEVEEYIRRNISVEGHAPIPSIPIGCCASCLLKRRLHQCLCYDCRMKSKLMMIYYEPGFQPTAHVGIMPLYSVHPRIVAKDYAWRSDHPIIFKATRGMTLSSKELSPYDFARALVPYYSDVTQRGRLCGPMFMGIRVTCFVRGDACTAIAAIFRNCIQPPQHIWKTNGRRDRVTYDFRQEFSFLLQIARTYFPELFSMLDVWSFQQVLDHQKDIVKKRLHVLTKAALDRGDQLPLKSLVLVKPFPKAEKHSPVELYDGEFVEKSKQIPRCISAFDPQVSTLLSPYTLPILKHLNFVFQWDQHIFYASGATPDQINRFLNNAVSQNRMILEDDVSMADASHSYGSLMYQKIFYSHNFPDMPYDIMSLLTGLWKGRFRAGRFKGLAEWLILSGVPLTSWGNSVVFIFIRLVALAYAYKLISLDEIGEEYDDPSQSLNGDDHYFKELRYKNIAGFRDLINSIYMAVAGDDGKTFLPKEFNGIKTFGSGFIEDYILAWSRFGFDVGGQKIRTYDESNWRLATFLAMRPVWSGQRYEYGPEIARRITGMFWQLDNSYHPVAWGRGIAIAMLTAARHVPVLSHICRWYLANTFGAANACQIPSFTNVYSTFYDYKVDGDLNERGLNEFLADYEISRESYEDFLSLLSVTKDVLVNIQHSVLDRIYAKQ